MLQVGPLADSFNVYIPDLLFFGKSCTKRRNRTEAFQAECVGAGLKRLGVERCSVYAISYGGYVGGRMAEIYPEMVEKMVIVSSGVGCSESLKKEQLNRVGIDAMDVLLPETPSALRLLGELSVYKAISFKWAPDFILHEFIDVSSFIAFFLYVVKGYFSWPVEFVSFPVFDSELFGLYCYFHQYFGRYLVRLS